MMKVENLKKSFKNKDHILEVLKGVSFEVSEGQTVALLGKSGSGKSTLLSLIAGLESADAGNIILDQQNITKMSEKELTTFRAQKMGIVFQQFHLVSTLSALENVMLPLEILKRSDSQKKATELLMSVGLSARLDHLPSELSGGECQRVAIARALVTGPSILFADEPSGNLDEETGRMVMDLLFKMVSQTKTTMILVTHDQELAKRCSRIIRLEHGSLV